MGDALVESGMQHGAAVFIGILCAEVVPETQRDGRQTQTAFPAAAVSHLVITFLVGGIHGAKKGDVDSS